MRLAVRTSGVEAAKRANAAIYKTIERSGTGEIVTSSRHSAEVAEFLASEGADPFDFSRVPEVQAMLTEAIEEVMDRVARTGRTESDYIRRIMIGAAMDAAEFARERITKGDLGKNTRRTADYKRRLVAQGKATSRYGDPPPYGVRSGDFVKDISGEWTDRKASR